MIIDKARELGLELAASEEFSRVVEARKRVKQDSALTDLMDEFKSKRDNMISLMQAEDIDRENIVSLSADIEKLQQQLYENPLFSELVSSEQIFYELVTSVNREINQCIGIEDDYSVESKCNGNCEACSGCSEKLN